MHRRARDTADEAERRERTVTTLPIILTTRGARTLRRLSTLSISGRLKKNQFFLSKRTLYFALKRMANVGSYNFFLSRVLETENERKSFSGLH